MCPAARSNRPRHIVEARRIEFVGDQRKLQLGLLRLVALIGGELGMKLRFPVLAHAPLRRHDDLRDTGIIKREVRMRLAFAPAPRRTGVALRNPGSFDTAFRSATLSSGTFETR